MKIRLHQTFGAHTGRTREFHEGVITFGRLPTSDFPFDPYADLDASGSHAELRWLNGAWVLRDVGSRNGTFVGGRMVREHLVRDGDEIEFGTGGPRVRVEFVASERPAGAGTLPATPIFGQGTNVAPASEPAGRPPLHPSRRPGAGETEGKHSKRPGRAHTAGTVRMPASDMPAAAPRPNVSESPVDGSSALWVPAAVAGLIVLLVFCLAGCLALGWLLTSR